MRGASALLARLAPRGRPQWRPSPGLAVVLALLVAQFALWHFRLVGIQPRLDVVPPVPTRLALEAAAFGDRQVLFRHKALELQAFGDAGGRSTPLEQYDYQELVRWFDALGSLDHRSAVVPTIAAFVFGQTKNPAQLRLVADYLRRHARRDPELHYRWTAHAAMIAAHRLNDPDLALSILSDLDGVRPEALPGWMRAMPAFLRARLGQERAALELFQAILKNGDALTDTERAYLVWQIEQLRKQIGIPREEPQGARK